MNGDEEETLEVYGRRDHPGRARGGGDPRLGSWGALPRQHSELCEH